METHLVVFTLANEQYGVGISVISEIIKLQPITYVPRAPAFVEGVTNLRGKVLPVLDLRKRFGLTVAAASRESRIVVAEINNILVGMVVDAVNEVLRVPQEAVEPPSPVVTTVDSAFISGIAKVGNRLIILLDLEKVLRPDERADLQQAFAPGAALAASAEAVVAPPTAAAEGAPRAPEPAVGALEELLTPPPPLTAAPAEEEPPPAEEQAPPPALPPAEEEPPPAAESQPPARPKKRRGRKKTAPPAVASPPEESPPAAA